MANPYEKYSEKPNPYAKYGPPEEEGILDTVGKTAGRFGVNVVRGAAQLPGVPVELGAMLGNVLRGQAGKEQVSLEDSPLKDWGSKGWLRAFEDVAGKADLPAPTSEFEASVDKAGQFVGGGLIFGPAGLLPSATGYVGSEGGRKLDEAGVTGGYGEPVGGVLGAMGPGLVRGQTTAGVRDAPSIAALRAAKNKAYAASEAEGAIFTPQAMQRLYAEASAKAANYGHDITNEPGIASALKKLEALQGSNVTLKGLENSVRKPISNAGRQFTNQSQVTLSGIMKDTIDDFLDSVQPGEVLTGNHARATQLIKQARSLNQRYRLGKTIEEAEYQAKNQAASSGVGGNLDNAMRQKIKAILNNPKRRSSFNASEIKLMERINSGSWSQNKLRQIGGFAPGRGFLPTALLGHLGFSAAGAGVPTLPVLAGAAAYAGLTTGAKRLSESITQRNFDRLSAAVRNERGAAPATAKQRANALLLEMQRRAKLAAKSAAAGTPGAVMMRTRPYPEAPEGYPYTVSRD